MNDEVQETQAQAAPAKPIVSVAKYGDRIVSDQPVNNLIDIHGEGAVLVNGKSISQHLDDAVAGVESDIAEFLHSIAGFADRVAARLQAKADETKAGEQAAEAAAADPVPVVAAPPVDERRVADDPAAEQYVGGRVGDNNA
jgi:hypothetical protein